VKKLFKNYSLVVRNMTLFWTLRSNKKCPSRGPENVDSGSSTGLGSLPIYTFYIEVYGNEVEKGENPLITRN